VKQYFDPKNDLTFKRVFGEHKHLCMSLLNSMIEDALIKGEAIGLEKGKAEGKAEIAIQLLKMGISLDDIMQCTGFTEKEIQSFFDV